MIFVSSFGRFITIEHDGELVGPAPDPGLVEDGEAPLGRTTENDDAVRVHGLDVDGLRVGREVLEELEAAGEEREVGQGAGRVGGLAFLEEFPGPEISQ